MKKIITLLGSTGSIGTQTLDVVRMHGLEVYALAAYDRMLLFDKKEVFAWNMVNFQSVKYGI